MKNPQKFLELEKKLGKGSDQIQKEQYYHLTKLIVNVLIATITKDFLVNMIKLIHFMKGWNLYLILQIITLEFHMDLYLLIMEEWLEIIIKIFMREILCLTNLIEPMILLKKQRNMITRKYKY